MNILQKLYLKYFRPEKYQRWKQQQQGTQVTPQPEPISFGPLEKEYLRKYPDVAAHSYFGSHPYEHYVRHGKAEGRVWEPSRLNDQNDIIPFPKDQPVPGGDFGGADFQVRFLFGAGINWESLINHNDIERAKAAAGNFDFLMTAAGEQYAFDYLIKHVDGGASFFRQVWSSRGLDNTESARLVNKYGVGSQRGHIDLSTNEYVFGLGFSPPGPRYKLPFPHTR